MRRFKYFTTTLFVLAVFVFTLPLAAQDGSPTAAKLNLKRISIPDQCDNIVSFRDLHFNDAGKGLALVDAYVGESWPLCTMVLARNGSTRLVDTLEREFYSTPFTSVVWIEDTESGSQNALLFFGGHDNYSRAAVYLAQYDSKGYFTREAIKLIELPKNDGTYAVSLSSLRASRGPSSVAVAATFLMYNYATNKFRPIGKFFETDFNGDLVGEIRDVPFDKTIKQQAAGFAPAWSGSKWLVPYRLFANDGRGAKCFIAKATSATSPAAANGRIVLSSIFNGGVKETVSGSSHLFAEADDDVAPAGASPLRMHLRIQNDITDFRETLVDWRYKSKMLGFDAKGVRSGQVRTLEFEIWDQAKVAEKGWILEDYSEFLSAFVPLDDGGYLVARGDRIEKYRQGTWPPAEFSSTGRVGLLAVDSKFKQVTEIAWRGLDAPETPNGNPILCRAGGCYVLLVDTIDTTQHKCYFYISTIEY